MLEIFTPDTLAALWRGTLLTLSLTFLAAFFGLLLGLLGALGRRSRFPVLRLIAGVYIEIFRGTPLLVQLFFLYFGLPQLTKINLPAFETAVLGLSLFVGAYTAEIIRGSLNGIGAGQIEAARALGMRTGQTMQLILLPQAARLAVPALSNQFIGLLKDSSLASVITVTELLLTVRGLVSVNYQPVPMYLAVGIIYFVLSNAAARVFALLEKNLNRPYALGASTTTRP